MYIEQFLKNDAFFIFSNNFVTPILNLVIEVQRPLFPSNDNIILKTLKVGKTITILETGTRCTNAVIFSELFHFSNKEGRLNQGKILLEILLKICAWVYWLQKYIALTLICIKWTPGDSRIIFLATIFTQKMPESSGSMHSSILMIKKHMISLFYLKWIEFTRNCECVPI